MLERLRAGALWPGTALAVWLAAWALWRAWPTLPLLSLLPLALGALLHRRPWRRWIVALGWPLALLVQGAALRPWAWALLGLALLALYPWRQWRDAPLYPTPAGALDGAAAHLPLRHGARVLDAGCGTGAGLRALRRAWPQAQIEGVEASRLLAWVARWRCRGWARVRRADLWADDWSVFDLVYLFQRPESMPAALDKARAQLRAGAWLLSLDFPLPGVRARADWPVGRHRLYLYPAESLK